MRSFVGPKVHPTDSPGGEPAGRCEQRCIPGAFGAQGQHAAVVVGIAVEVEEQVAGGTPELI
jgi:hypothetical protein